MPDWKKLITWGGGRGGGAENAEKHQEDQCEHAGTMYHQSAINQ
jgi:hypothetical protein